MFLCSQRLRIYTQPSTTNDDIGLFREELVIKLDFIACTTPTRVIYLSEYDVYQLFGFALTVMRNT